MNEANEILKDIARDTIEEKMLKNPTIPAEAKEQLINEEYNYLLHEGESKVEEPEEFEAEDCTEGDEE
jgi:SNF2 family DNA or RNA helicase